MVEPKVAKLSTPNTNSPPPTGAMASGGDGKCELLQFRRPNRSNFAESSIVLRAVIFEMHLDHTVNFPSFLLTLKTDILTQNINLPEMSAPYRTLLGMDDKYLEQEQAIKFIKSADGDQSAHVALIKDRR